MRKVEEIIVKRKCKKCNKFHYKKVFKFDDYKTIDDFILDIEWYIYIINQGYYDRVCK